MNGIPVWEWTDVRLIMLGAASLTNKDNYKN